MNEDVLYAGFQAQFFDFLENYETPLDFSPLDAVKVLKEERFSKHFFPKAGLPHPVFACVFCAFYKVLCLFWPTEVSTLKMHNNAINPCGNRLRQLRFRLLLH